MAIKAHLHLIALQIETSRDFNAFHLLPCLPMRKLPMKVGLKLNLKSINDL